MRLLVVTQAVDERDGVLGFFCRWIEEFAKYADSVTVICLREGEYHLPKNVRVYSLGKEQDGGRAVYIARFFKLIWRLRNEYDLVFVHMNPEYVILGAALWRLLRKRIGLWYTHKHVDLKLRLATLFADRVFTASKKSFRLPSKKVFVMGHGIDVAAFSLARLPRARGAPIRIFTAGRISATKRVREMLAALDELHAHGVPFVFSIAGTPSTPADEAYAKALTHDVSVRPYKDSIYFLGPVVHANIPKLLSETDVFLNLSSTGSLDKAVLEAMAAGVPVVTSNEAFKGMLSQSQLVAAGEPAAIAAAILNVREVDTEASIKLIEKQHSLASLIPAILAKLAFTA